MARKLSASRFWFASALIFGSLGIGMPVQAGSVEITVTESGGKPTDHAVVYLVSSGAPASPPPASAPAVMDQQDKEFVPHVLPIFTGTPVSFPNRDNIKHHVYSFSPAKKFELPLYSGTPANPVVFDKAGIVALGCNIHDWMVGYIYVLPTPLFARTGPDGRARIADVPDGVYEVKVWHPRIRGSSAPASHRIVVGVTDIAPVGFVLSLKREWKAPRGLGRYENIQGG